MRWRLRRPRGTVEGYESELLNEHETRIATVHCGFNPLPPHAALIADAPEAVEACKLFTELLGLHPEINRLLQSQHDKGWNRAIDYAAMVTRSQNVALGRMDI
jgi:hypothetical protein